MMLQERCKPWCARTRGQLRGTAGSFHRLTSPHTISNGLMGSPENTVASNLCSREDQVKL